MVRRKSTDQIASAVVQHLSGNQGHGHHRNRSGDSRRRSGHCRPDSDGELPNVEVRKLGIWGELSAFTGGSSRRIPHICRSTAVILGTATGGGNGLRCVAWHRAIPSLPVFTLFRFAVFVYQQIERFLDQVRFVRALPRFTALL